MFRWILSLLLVFNVHAELPKYGQWRAITQLSDEFNNGVLNSTKWQNIHPYSSGRPPGVFRADNVSIKNNNLNLKVSSLPNNKIATAIVRATHKIKYGYFEIKAKANSSSASSAFFFYQWTKKGTFEIDVVEIGGGASGKKNIFYSNAHVYLGDPALENESNRVSDPQKFFMPAPLADDYHLYALEWDDLELRWYFDNQLIRRKKNIYWHQPMQLVLDTEIFPNWLGVPNKESLPTSFKIDYIRAWQRTDIDIMAK